MLFSLFELAQIVGKISRDAGTLIMKVYNEATQLMVENKADSSPITLADKLSNELICTQLEDLVLNFPIISEENKEIPYAIRKDYNYFWLVDPLDGTKEFIKRNGEFTVNVALVHRQIPVLGVVYVPAQQVLYWGAKGEGSYKTTTEGDTQRLRVNEFDITANGLKVVSSRSHLNPQTEAYIRQLNEPDFVPVGSSLKFLYVAEGKAVIYPRFIPCMEWDTAAAQLILTEAGGKVMDVLSGEPLLYNKENLLNPNFIAFGKTSGNILQSIAK